MKQYLQNLVTVLAVLCGIHDASAWAAGQLPKQALKANYQLVYRETPGSVERVGEMFTHGMVYGRLRSNSFYYGWEQESGSQDSHSITGLGGSLVYKTACFSDIDLTGALYYARAFFDNSDDPVNQIKAGKDLLSRFDYANTGSKAMGVLGQAYFRYGGLPETDIMAGRQLVETFYTKSNDTKMIPNTFDAVVIDTRAVPETTVRIGYLAMQKLRDHTQAHSVLMYGDSASTESLKPEWSENDDAAMHKGLSYSNLEAAGVDTAAPLIVGDIHMSFAPLRLDAAFYTVPDLLSEVMFEGNYRITAGGMVLVPGVRYIRQFDNGAGKIGGAAYSGTLAGLSGSSGGYDEADSLDSQMIAIRLVASYGPYKLNFGYSQVMDEADLVTPWRGFPTAGYTRSMARYNWMADTKSYRVELTRNADARGIYDALFMQCSLLHTDADESKGYFDENYYYVGLVQNIPNIVELQWRLRLGYADTDKTDADALDARFEINYLF